MLHRREKMNIHEYQGKQVLAKYGVAIPRGHVAFSVDEAIHAARTMGGTKFVVKSQIHAGGRGAGHGITQAEEVAFGL